jgi:hypothetical protein
MMEHKLQRCAMLDCHSYSSLCILSSHAVPTNALWQGGLPGSDLHKGSFFMISYNPLVKYLPPFIALPPLDEII